ncbi:MAG TPA: hypothetical protein VF702_01615 [Allosphingosinicella sp.]|jgi:hypothetical protein
MRLADLLAVASALGTGTAAARQPEPPTITRAELRAMSDEEVGRRLFGDIGAIMHLIRFAEPDETEARHPVRGLQFLSRPRGTYRIGICETDRVTVYFEPARGPGLPRDAARPRRIQVSTNYFVRDVGLARQHRAPDNDRNAGEEHRLDSACAEIDPRGANIVIAANEQEVADAVVLLADLAAAVSAGRIAIPVDCSEMLGAVTSSADCLAHLERIEPGGSFSVQIIPGCYAGDPALFCRRIELFGGSERRALLFEFRRGSLLPVRIALSIVPPDEF